jgi:hypothetical protein
MDVSGATALGQVYAVRVEKLSQDATKATGEAAVALIESVPKPPQVGLEGQGRLINTYA